MVLESAVYWLRSPFSMCSIIMKVVSSQQTPNMKMTLLSTVDLDIELTTFSIGINTSAAEGDFA